MAWGAGAVMDPIRTASPQEIQQAAAEVFDEWVEAGRAAELEDEENELAQAEWIDAVREKLRAPDLMTTFDAQFERKHRRDRRGRFSRKRGPSKVGITPSRVPLGSYGAAQSQRNDPEYARLEREFERAVNEAEIGEAHRTVGVWESEFEPSYEVESPEQISTQRRREQVEKLRRRFGQQSAMIFTYDPQGEDAEMTIEGFDNADRFAGQLESIGLSGATFPSAGKASVVVTADQAEAVQKLDALAREHGWPLSHERGNAEFVG
jgi:hypothetical protein